MGITHYIKSFFTGKHSKKFHGINTLASEEQFCRVTEIFYEECLRSASEFITDELRKKDSPFNAASREKFFHEVMAINLWLIDKTFEGKKKRFMEKIADMYRDHFKLSPALDINAILERYSVYYEAWNDVTGHQDIFGQRAAERIFGKGANYSALQTSFWIITHAYNAMDDFEKLAKQLRNMKIKLAA